MSQQNKVLCDWGSIALICPCQLDSLSDINEARDLNGRAFKMIQNARQVNYVCPQCQNSFDYEVKVKLFESLIEYYENTGSFEGFNKNITRKGQRIRLKYIKTLKLIKKTNQKDIILIEAANLTTHSQYKTQRR